MSITMNLHKQNSDVAASNVSSNLIGRMPSTQSNSKVFETNFWEQIVS